MTFFIDATGQSLQADAKAALRRRRTGIATGRSSRRKSEHPTKECWKTHAISVTFFCRNGRIDCTSAPKNGIAFQQTSTKSNTTGTPVFQHWALLSRARAMAHGRPVGSLLFDMALFDMLFVLRLIMVFDFTHNMIQQIFDPKKARKKTKNPVWLTGCIWLECSNRELFRNQSKPLWWKGCRTSIRLHDDIMLHLFTSWTVFLTPCQFCLISELIYDCTFLSPEAPA